MLMRLILHPVCNFVQMRDALHPVQNKADKQQNERYGQKIADGADEIVLPKRETEAAPDRDRAAQLDDWQHGNQESIERMVQVFKHAVGISLFVILLLYTIRWNKSRKNGIFYKSLKTFSRPVLRPAPQRRTRVPQRSRQAKRA